MTTQGQVALVTGVGRRAGIGAAIVERLAATGWDLGFTYWQPYDARMPWGQDPEAVERLKRRLAELRVLGCADVVNPGPTQTGWIDDELAEQITQATPLGRLGRPVDCANLVAFLCSPEGGWINGQLIQSDGGMSAAG